MADDLSAMVKTLLVWHGYLCEEFGPEAAKLFAEPGWRLVLQKIKDSHGELQGSLEEVKNLEKTVQDLLL